MKLRLLFLVAGLLLGSVSRAQVTIFSENMGTPGGTTTIAANVFQNSGTLTYSGTADVRNTTNSTGYAGASGGGNVFVTNTVGRNFEISGINTSTYSGLTLSFGHYKSTTASNGSELVVEVSPDGATYAPLAYTRPTGAGTANWILINPTGAIPSAPNLRIRFRQTGTATQFRIDDVVLQGTPSFVTDENGLWSAGTTWAGGVAPGPGDNATVNHIVTDATGITRNAGTTTTISTGASLTVTNGYANSGTTTVDGSFNLGLGVTVNAGSAFRVNGTCRIDTNGFFAVGSPVFGPASTLVYNTGGTYGRGFEWIALGVGTIGTTPGYPNNVQVSNNTILNYPNGATCDDKALAGGLTIDAGSAFYMDYGGNSPLGPLTIAGNFTNNGNFSMGNANGDDVRLAGNFANTGNFFGNGRAMFFTKSTGTQTVSSSTALNIPYVVFDAVGNRTVQLLSNLTIGAPGGGNAIAFGSASDIFDLNGHALTVGTAAVANAVTGAGTFSGSAASSLTLLGAGNIGTLNFTTGSQSLGTFTIDRTGAALAATLGTPLAINTGLVLTNGCLDVGNNALTIGAAATVTGAASGYVIADRANGANAAYRKIFTGAGNHQWRLGDAAASADGSQFTAATATISGGTYAAGAYISMAVADVKEPNLDAGTSYITRYWDVSTSGIGGSPVINGSFYYTDADIAGTEADCTGNDWTGSSWTNNGDPVATALNQFNAYGFVPGSVNHITAAYRDPEINVVNAATTTDYLAGSTYSFGNILTGASATVTLTIQNTGQQPLTLGAATTTPGAAPFSYSAFTPGVLNGPAGTTTFTVAFAPTAGGTFSASISIPNTDASGGENPYVINFTGVGVVPSPEINIRANSGGGNNIISGSVTADPLNNTLFAATNIGSSAAKDYEIQNLGTAVLDLTGAPMVSIGGANPSDFAVTTAPGTSAIANGAGTVFIITFSPTASGVRTAIVSVANTDSDENPYTFLIQGTGVCAASANTVTPLSGPEGTVVTITASANNLTGATASFNGVPAAVTQISATQITVVVPAGAVSGSLTTTNSQGCQASNTFTVIDNAANGCQGGNVASELFMSEITDATTGGVSYVEIYNATSASVNMSGYALRTYSNGSTGAFTGVPLNNFVLNPQSVYIVAIGIAASPSTANTCTGVTGGNGSLANQSTTAAGINFDPGANDYIGLYKNSTASIVDSFGVFGSATWADGLGLGDRGATFRRKNNVTVPQWAFAASDWNITDWAGSGQASCTTNDYSDIGAFNFIAGNPPTITAHPAYTPNCTSATFSVVATEGFAGGNPLAYQWYFTSPGSPGWSVVPDDAVVSGGTTDMLDISNIAGFIGYQFYCEVRENGATCYSASNAVMISALANATWDGAAWTPSAPSASTPAVIDGNYDTAVNGSFEACSLTVLGGRTLTIAGGDYVSVVNDLTVNAAGSLLVLNNGSLVMIEDGGVVTNNGTMQVSRTTMPFVKYDYTYWSSPVTSTTMGAVFSGWRMDYSWTFNTANYSDVTGPNGTGPADGFDDDNNTWVLAGAGASLVPGKGYVIMGPTNLPSYPAAATVTFSGTVNNGVVSIPLAMSGNPAAADDDFNIIGNPYPSAVFADDFINLNTNTSGTVKFWTHQTPVSNTAPGPYQANFVTSDYAMYNLSGGTASGSGSTIPTGSIASGQGFLVEAVTGTNVVFNNSMRDKLHDNSNFYRASQSQAATIAQKDRVWLNFEHEIGLFSQQLVAYTEAATLEYDRGYDGIVSKSGNTVSFYSFIGADKYRIQGRPAFSIDDIVPMGYSTGLPGTYTIRIDHAEGQLNDPSVNIYIEDKLLQLIHNLKESDYVFTTALGTFNDRFRLRYTDAALGVPDAGTGNPVSMVSFGQVLEVRARTGIRSIEVYDMLGRNVFKQDAINAADFSARIAIATQPLLVKVTLSDGSSVSRKILY